MIKVKALILGVVSQIVLFLVLMCLLAVAAGSFGNIKESGYLLVIEAISAVSVLAGAFLSARLAWERGAVYGVLVAFIWIILRVVFCMIMALPIEPISLVIKAAILLGLGVVGGALGIGKRNVRMI